MLRSYLHTALPGAAGAAILLITLATVSYQSLKTALMNPIKSLKTE